MENTETPKAPETIISSFAVVLDELQDPPWIHLFHVNDEYDEIAGGEEDEDVAQPSGFKLPGGRYEVPRDETPRHTAQNETLLEIGLNVKPAKLFSNRNSPYGEALQEHKTFVNKRGKVFFLKVYTFFMERIDNTVVGTVEKNEGGGKASFSLADILTMPLARNTRTGEKNSYGIHHSARKRIFITLRRAGYDFMKLIPELPWLIDKINRGEVGEDIYLILKDAISDSENHTGVEDIPKETEIEPVVTSCKKDCDCDVCWRRFAEAKK